MSTKSIPLTSYQIRLLAVLALINFVNFAARQVFVPLIPVLRDHLHVTDAELGSVQTFLLVVLAVGSIPFGFLADRFSRKAIIGTGILFWSIATFAGGLASSFMFFLIARAIVGLGEAAYEITYNDSLREEFNRWAEAGRGEGMEQEHLPITLPVLEKKRLGVDSDQLLPRQSVLPPVGKSSHGANASSFR